jgi:hypothetical protein
MDWSSMCPDPTVQLVSSFLQSVKAETIKVMDDHGISSDLLRQVRK